jgi:hypothetical protein
MPICPTMHINSLLVMVKSRHHPDVGGNNGPFVENDE